MTSEMILLLSHYYQFYLLLRLEVFSCTQKVIWIAGVPRIFTDAENAEISQLESQFAGEDDLPYLNYIRTSRININIRQVF